MDLQVKARLRWRLSLLCRACLSVSEIKRIVEDKLAEEKEFSYNSHRLNYFFHSYNNFGLTERAIEVPLIRYYLEQADYRNVLEIGNVTNHYYDYYRQSFIGKNKTTVDKFEPGYGVINADIAEYGPGVKFDFIYSISTFEHMDSDLGRNPDYVEGSSRLISVAADNIKYVSDVLLQNGGKFVITAPLGYTPEWDLTFYSDDLERCNCSRFGRYLLKRKKELTCEQIDVEEGRTASLDPHLPYREYLSILEFDK